jgi:NTE family protein
MGTARRRVGIALSGGGARGLAHIGVLKVLEGAGVPIDALAGTSMGGLVAAAYACGLAPAALEQEALHMASLRRLLTLADPTLPRRGLFEGQKVREYLAARLGDRDFGELRLPLTLVAVDLNTGSEVHLRQGRVADAVRATIALPGIFMPVERDGQLLVDGGVLNNLPANVVRQMGADVVIAVDVAMSIGMISSITESLRQRRYVPEGLMETVEVLYRSLGVMMAEIQRRRLAEAQPEVLITPALPAGVTVLTGFRRAAEIIAVGEEAARQALPRILDLL